jgi:hypothetical protein
MKEAQSIVVINDLYFGVKDFVFEAKVLNKYGTLDQITNKNTENSGYAYLHYDLLYMASLTTIIF